MARASNTDERRAQIARALRRVMARKGYDGASIADIAAEAGLGAGLVHYHFSSKLEILLAVLEDLEATHQAVLDGALAPVGEDPAEEVGAFVDAHLSLGSEDAESLACWIMLSGEALREARVRAAYEAALRTTVERLTEIVARGARAKLFTTKEPEAAASAIVAAIQGYFMLAATARDLIPRGSAARAVRAMAAGLLGSSRLAVEARTKPTKRTEVAS